MSILRLRYVRRVVRMQAVKVMATIMAWKTWRPFQLAKTSSPYCTAHVVLGLKWAILEMWVDTCTTSVVVQVAQPGLLWRLCKFCKYRPGSACRTVCIRLEAMRVGARSCALRVLGV